MSKRPYIYDANHFRTMSVWLKREENQEEINDFRRHLESVYPELKDNENWLIDKYRERFRYKG